MEDIRLGDSEVVSSRLIYGCMRICGDGSANALQKGRGAIQAAVEAGYTHFDHADIYGGGRSESLFGEVLAACPDLREKVLITSKCGIRLPDEPSHGDPNRYDFSKDYILNSVDGSLRRLGVDYLDLLLLHRPDYLFSAAEVAETFHELKEAGKVLNFGVSNFSPSQFSLLQQDCDDPLLVNQVEINIDNIATLSDGTLDQCQQLNVTPMAWCPLGGVVYPAWGQSLSAEQTDSVRFELERQSEHYGAEPWITMLAWLMKHPAGIAPIVGSTEGQRIRAALGSLELDYSREDWYRLLQARNGQEVP